MLMIHRPYYHVCLTSCKRIVKGVNGTHLAFLSVVVQLILMMIKLHNWLVFKSRFYINSPGIFIIQHRLIIKVLIITSFGT